MLSVARKPNPLRTGQALAMAAIAALDLARPMVIVPGVFGADSPFHGFLGLVMAFGALLILAREFNLDIRTQSFLRLVAVATMSLLTAAAFLPLLNQTNEASASLAVQWFIPLACAAVGYLWILGVNYRCWLDLARPVSPVAIAMLASTIAAGLVLIVGWWSDIDTIKHADVLAANGGLGCALALMLGPLSLYLALIGSPRLAVIVMLPALGNALMELLGTQFAVVAWLDQVLPHPGFAVGGEARLEVTPHDSVIVLIGSIATLAAARARARPLWWFAVWASGLCAGMVALLGLYDFLSGVPRWFGDHRYVPAGVLTMLGLMAYAAALIAAGRPLREARWRHGTWRASGAAIVSMMLSVYLWQSLGQQQLQALQRATSIAGESVGTALQRFTVVRLTGVADLAERMHGSNAEQRTERYFVIANQLLRDTKGAEFLVWLDHDGHVLGQVHSTARVQQPTDIAQWGPEALSAFESATRERHRVASAPIKDHDGGISMLFVFPIEEDQGDIGALVLQVDSSELLGALLETTARGFDVRVSDGAVDLLRRSVLNARVDNRVTHSGDIELYGRQWTWRVRATSLVIPAIMSRLPEVVLFAGLITGALLALALKLAVIARDRAATAEAARGVMEREAQAREQAQRELSASRRYADEILQALPEGFLSVDREFRVVYVNPRAEVMLRRAASDLLGLHLIDVFPPDEENLLIAEAARCVADNHSASLDVRLAWLDRWLAVNVYPRGEGLAFFFRDISDRRRVEQFERRQRALIEQIATSLRPQSETLESVIGLFEDQFPAASGSILLYDGEANCVRHGAAPNLPGEYNLLIDGIRVRDGAGSCGTAIARRARVMVSDIEHDPLWIDYRDVALRFGLRACWSQPIFASDRRVLGTFAVYYREVREPTEAELDAIGLVAAVAGIAIERAESLAQIRNSEQRFRSLFEYHPDAVFALDPTGRLLDCNTSLIAMSGRRREEIIGKRFLSADLPESREENMRRFEDALHGSPQSYETRAVRANGRMYDVHVTMLPTVVDNRIVGVFGVAKDITEQRHTQRLLLERNRFFELSLEMFCIIGADGSFRQINAAFTRVLGFAAEELVGASWLDFVHPDETEVARGALDGLLRDGRLGSLETRYRCRDGGYRWLDWNSMVAPDGLIYAVARDVTDRRLIDAELSRVMQELKFSNRELQDFAFVASHDLQEPLRKIQVFSDRLLASHGGSLDAQGRDFLERMDGAARRMQVLIDDLLAYSRITTRAQPFALVDLNRVARDVLQDLETRIESTAAAVNVGALPAIEADPTQMRQLLQNLIANALKFRAPDRPSRVDITAQVVQGNGAEWCVMEVTDNGIGFDNRFRERIFAPFQRLHGRSAYEGTGMGLAIVRKIVERHGGAIEADGTPDVGARFTVHLPVRQNARAERGVTTFAAEVLG